jgi:hypothetical protein
MIIIPEVYKQLNFFEQIFNDFDTVQDAINKISKRLSIPTQFI